MSQFIYLLLTTPHKNLHFGRSWGFLGGGEGAAAAAEEEEEEEQQQQQQQQQEQEQEEGGGFGELNHTPPPKIMDSNFLSSHIKARAQPENYSNKINNY